MKHAMGFTLWLAVLSICSCKSDRDKKGTNTKDAPPVIQVTVPTFNADSSFAFIERQLSFGPRVPGTPEHVACGDWLEEKLRGYSNSVIIQRAKQKLFTGETIEIRNIIAQFNPEIKRRVLLCAHWDTRMFADRARENQDQPIPGANDGGSGVGVLLEIARQFAAQPLKEIGVDIILFDAEDQGFPENMPGFKAPRDPSVTWCLGSQHWARNRHRMDYAYLYGILLDMVGASGATFPREGYSMYYAPHVVEAVWKEARSLGYGRFFINVKTNEILDDHYFINTLANIPTIDIIHADPDTRKFHYSWHTHEDNISVISRATLEAVGQTVLSVIYKEAAEASVVL